MAIDDPGWGGFTSLPDYARDPPPPTPRTRPPWVVPVAGGGAVLVLVIILVAVLAGGSKPSPHPSPNVVSTLATQLTPPAFIARADAICTSVGPQLAAAVNADNPQAFAIGLQSIFTQTRALGDPTQGADNIHAYLAAVANAASAYNQGQRATGSQFANQAGSLAGEYGMSVCSAL